MRAAKLQTKQKQAVPPQNESPTSSEADALLPFEQVPWQTLFDSLALFSDDFMTERNQPTFDEAERFPGFSREKGV